LWWRGGHHCQRLRQGVAYSNHQPTRDQPPQSTWSSPISFIQNRPENTFPSS
jgi:hypothetical protein